MNDVNLNSPDLKLVRTSEQAPARAISSSQSEGRNASDLAASPSGRLDSPEAVSQSRNVSGTEKAQERNDSQREQLDEAVSRLNDYVQNVQRDLQFEVRADGAKLLP